MPSNLYGHYRKALKAALEELQWITEAPRSTSVVYRRAKKAAEDARAALAVREEPQGYDWKSKTTWRLRVCEICGRDAANLTLTSSCEHRMVEVVVAPPAAREDTERPDEHNGIPDSYWREVPCGHPLDPVALRNKEGDAVCHCGRGLDGVESLPDTPFGAPGPIVPCEKCGCYVAVPVRDTQRQEIGKEELKRLIDKMLDYDLFADPEDVERQRVIACDLIRVVRDTERPKEHSAEPNTREVVSADDLRDAIG